MKALELREYGGPLHLVEKPVPRAGPGEVLVRVAAAPINPSDLGFIAGRYGIKKPLPVVPGWEGSGTVVAAGAGLMAGLRSGKRVAFMADAALDGSWAEYAVAKAKKAMPLFGSVTLEQGAMMFVNPWTAWALVDMAVREEHDAIIHTAAGGALGRMLLRLGLRRNLPIIHCVRRAAQAEMLKGQGAEHVLDSSAADFVERLKDLAACLNATIAFDPIGGEMTGRVLGAMPQGSKIVVYGSLSGQPCQVPTPQLVYEQKKVEGYWTVTWAAGRSLLGLARVAFSVQKHMGDDFRTEVRTRVSLDQAAEALESYKKDMSAGKVLLVPGGEIE
jgi:NADPH:quinone reductase-like Zn-dependent oxidoreductase